MERVNIHNWSGEWNNADLCPGDCSHCGLYLKEKPHCKLIKNKQEEAEH